jgi:hypothetical protein
MTGAVLASAGLLYYFSTAGSQPMLEEWPAGEEGQQQGSSEHMYINRARQLSEAKKAQLAKIRRQFENARQKFLPTLRVKIFEVVDCSDTIQELRRLRSTSSASLQRDAEEALWEKIKIQSISIMFVSVYMTCVVCTVLKLQFHLLGSYSEQCEVALAASASLSAASGAFDGGVDDSIVSDVTLSPIAPHRRGRAARGGSGAPSEAGASQAHSQAPSLSPFGSELFLALIEHSYGHLLHEGLAALGRLCQEKTAAIFGSPAGSGARHKWYYKNVTGYSELMEDLVALRRSVEEDLDANIIQLALLRKELTCCVCRAVVWCGVAWWP